MTTTLPASLTVVTICRNALPLLRETVESVLGQDHPGLEYWIVDGASTDGTSEYLASLRPRGVRVLSEADRGISDAMNKGIHLASGEWIAHLHAGDRYLPGALDGFDRAVKADPTADVVCGSIIKQEDAGEVLCRAMPARLEIEMTVPHPAVFARTQCWKDLGGFDEQLANAMDYDLFLRARLAGVRFVTLDQPVATVAGGGQSERSLWKTLEETHTIRRRLLHRGWSCSTGFVIFLFVKGNVRIGLQRIGLHRFVDWYRRSLAPTRKEQIRWTPRSSR